MTRAPLPPFQALRCGVSLRRGRPRKLMHMSALSCSLLRSKKTFPAVNDKIALERLQSFAQLTFTKHVFLAVPRTLSHGPMASVLPQWSRQASRPTTPSLGPLGPRNRRCWGELLIRRQCKNPKLRQHEVDATNHTRLPRNSKHKLPILT